MCSSHTVAKHWILTYGCGLQHECDNAKEVDVGIIHSELNKDSLGIRIKPGAVIKVLKGPTETQKNNMIYTWPRNISSSFKSWKDKSWISISDFTGITATQEIEAYYATFRFKNQWEFLIKIKKPTCWNLVNLAPDPPRNPLLCRVPHCPRWGRPSVYPGTGMSTGREGSARCYLPKYDSSLDRRSPCPPTPMSTEHDSLAQIAAWTERHGRSFFSPSPGGGERYPPALSFRPW